MIETLEFLDGCKVYEAVAAGHRGELLSKNTLEILIKQTFEDGFFHAEPHPGNLIIMGAHDAPVLGMVDLGLVGRRGRSVRLRARWRGGQNVPGLTVSTSPGRFYVNSGRMR